MNMAIYHCSIKIGSKGKGQSAIAAAAYRSGTKLYEEETGLTSDYTKKRNVIFSEIALCENALQEYQDRATLWNAVQSVESAKDSQLWREIEVALPIEFSREQQIEVVRKFVAQLTAQGMCADWSIHEPDEEIKNPHAHIMLTTRSILPDGKWAPKAKKIYDLDENGNKIPLIDKETGEQKVDKNNRKQWKNHKENYNNWNEKERVEEWRTVWEIVCNELLPNGKKIDHRSYERQGIDKIPTKHEGYVARQMAARGKVSERVEINREIREYNAELRHTEASLQQIEREITELTSNLEKKLQDLQARQAKIQPKPQASETFTMTIKDYAREILERRNKYFADSINLTVRKRVSQSLDYNKFELKRKAEQAEVAIKSVPSLAAKIRGLAEKIKSLLPIIKHKEKKQLTAERTEAVGELKEKMIPIIAIGVGKDFDCENPTESSTNDVCKKANDKIKKIKEEAASEQDKRDLVERLSSLNDEIITEDLQELKAAFAQAQNSPLTAPERAQLAEMITKPYKPTGNNRVSLKVEKEYTALIRQLRSDTLSQQEREKEQLPQRKRKGQHR